MWVGKSIARMAFLVAEEILDQREVIGSLEPREAPADYLLVILPHATPQRYQTRYL